MFLSTKVSFISSYFLIRNHFLCGKILYFCAKSIFNDMPTTGKKILEFPVNGRVPITSIFGIHDAKLVIGIIARVRNIN